MNRGKVFVSYRRQTGAEIARLVKESLRKRGYREEDVFLDVEDLRSGPFNIELLNRIESATDVVVVLTPGSLDRCTNPGDWVRQEVAHAIKCKKNIVPVMARGFEFPTTELPKDIQALPTYNGIAPSHDLFEASMDKLASLLVGRPKPRRAGLYLTIGAAALLTFVGAMAWVWHQVQSPQQKENSPLEKYRETENGLQEGSLVVSVKEQKWSAMPCGVKFLRRKKEWDIPTDMASVTVTLEIRNTSASRSLFQIPAILIGKNGSIIANFYLRRVDGRPTEDPNDKTIPVPEGASITLELFSTIKDYQELALEQPFRVRLQYGDKRLALDPLPVWSVLLEQWRQSENGSQDGTLAMSVKEQEWSAMPRGAALLGEEKKYILKSDLASVTVTLEIHNTSASRSLFRYPVLLIGKDGSSIDSLSLRRVDGRPTEGPQIEDIPVPAGARIALELQSTSVDYQELVLEQPLCVGLTYYDKRLDLDPLPALSVLLEKRLMLGKQRMLEKQRR